MLLPLLPTQVDEYWPLVRDYVEESLPPIAGKGADISKILFGLMIGVMQMWLFTDKEQKMKGFVITTMMQDMTDSFTLLVYCAVLMDKEAKASWEVEFEAMKLYAKSKGCTKIALYLANEKIVKLLKEQGFDVKTYASIDV